MSRTFRRYLTIIPTLLLGASLLIGSAPSDERTPLITALLQIGTPADTVKFTPGNTLYLEPNFPNPFLKETTIAFTLEESAVVTLKIYDAFYNPVFTLIDGEQLDAGRSQRLFDTESRLASGMYFYTLEIKGGEKLTRRMLLRR